MVEVLPYTAKNKHFQGCIFSNIVYFTQGKGGVVVQSYKNPKLLFFSCKARQNVL
jgi:hypothetical protein